MMRNRLISLILMTIAVLGVGMFLTQRQQPDAGGGAAPGALVAGLADTINEVSSLKITGPKANLIAELAKQDQGWVVVNRNNYPADLTKVREYLIKLADSNIREVKTSKPENYARLGVEDLSIETATGLGVELGGLKAPVKLIVGISAGTGTPGTFVRRDGEAQSLLVSGDLVPERESGNWMHKEIVDLPSSQVLSVTVTAPDKSVLKIEKPDPNAFNYTVLNIPKGRQLSSDSAGNLVAGSLASLALEDASPTAQAQVDAANQWSASYLGVDGFAVDVTLWGDTETAWARFNARVDDTQLDQWVTVEQLKANAARAEAQATAAPADAASKPADPAATAAAAPAAATAATDTPPAFDPVKAKADKRADLERRVAELNQRTQAWTYKIPAWKAANIKKKTEDLLQPKT